MTIVCGTDFTEGAGRAARVAALVAVRSKVDLALVHVAELAGAEQLVLDPAVEPASPLRMHVQEEIDRLRTRLREEAAKLAPYGAKVVTDLVAGTPDEALTAYADRKHAAMIVVSALGRRSSKFWRLGSTADRVAQIAKVPVLIVRGGEALEAGLRGAQKITIVVGIDSSPTSDAAVRWVDGFARHSECRVVGAHVYWPPEVRERLALPAPSGSPGIPIGKGHADVEAALKRELAPRLAALPGGSRVELALVGGLGRPADHLAQIAAGEKADVLVVGSHQRSGLDRVWHGSASHGVIDLAEMSVVCVPTVASK
jgi:nucleotide-binding universal stress UspA family protein